MSRDIKQSLETKGDYRIVAPPADAPTCTDGDTDCILKQARAAGVALVMAVAVHKASAME
jgi:hypothetical protein